MGANLAPEVVKNKEVVLQKHLSWDEDTMRHFKNQDLLVKKDWDEIEKLKSEREQKSLFLQKSILTVKSEKDFKRLCEILEPKSPWLSDELEYELSAANKSNLPDEPTEKECGMIVFREFGAEKRLSEGEKKALNEIMKYKIQCTKNIWGKQVERNLSNTKELEDMVTYAEDTASKTCLDIEEFVTENKNRLKSRVFGRTSKTTTDLFAEKKKRKPLDNLDFHVDVLIDMATQSLVERENTIKEKGKGMKCLQMEDSVKELDISVKEYLADSAKKQLSLRMLKDEKDNEIEDLYMTTENIKDHRERKLREKNKELHDKHSKVIEQDSELKARNSEKEQLERQLEEAQEELDEFKERKESLEKGKRVQTIYTRDGAKATDEGNVAIANEIAVKKNEKQGDPVAEKEAKPSSKSIEEVKGKPGRSKGKKTGTKASTAKSDHGKKKQK